MKKFVILFLLTILSFTTHATETAETIIPEVILAPAVELVIDPAIKVETFAVDLTLPEIQTTVLPTEAELRCMQENLYFEARNQGEKGMQAVANVTMHRTQDKRYPSTVCGVVKEQKVRGICQFSWFCDKRLRNGPRLLLAAELEAWNLAREIALKAFDGTLTDLVAGATHYHATYVRPKWARRLDKTIRIGTHIFYR